MCGRFAQSRLVADLVEEFGITGTSPESPLPANWNIAPTVDIYIVRQDRDNSRSLATASWGIIAPWQKTFDAARTSQSHAINARSESVHEKPTFRDAFCKRRCLIPADGYYEWATALGDYPPKQPFFISSATKRALPLAGIWSTWISDEGHEIESAAIITREAVAGLATIHSRMPVVMPPERWSSWLDPGVTSVPELLELMELEDPAADLIFHPVSRKVNSAANSGPTLTEPIELGAPETLF